MAPLITTAKIMACAQYMYGSSRWVLDKQQQWYFIFTIRRMSRIKGKFPKETVEPLRNAIHLQYTPFLATYLRIPPPHPQYTPQLETKYISPANNALLCVRAPHMIFKLWATPGRRQKTWSVGDKEAVAAAGGGPATKQQVGSCMTSSLTELQPWRN